MSKQTKINDGGPASNMSVRDMFAATALNGMLASDSSVDRTKVNKRGWAKVAYQFADAMLTARQKASAD